MKSITLKNQNELRAFFENENLFMSKGSVLNFKNNLILGNNVHFEGRVKFGSDNTVLNNSKLINCNFKNENRIRDNSLISDFSAGSKNILGPFCFIRNGTMIGNSNILGAYNEITKTKIHNDIKISHKVFIGNTIIKSGCIIGAGFITANYNMGKRYKCFIKQKTTIGCNTTLISPVNIGSNVIIGAGSIINKDIKNNKKVIQKVHTTINEIG
jgi:bifunctional UDP-N-acetylglucosamine pyrophosphorylase/glucosamine-1-phosphate N-acetyltransferase